MDFGLENPELYEIMYMFHPQSMERLPKDLSRRARRGYDFVAQTVLAAAPAGALAEADARILAASLWATLHGGVATLLTGRLDARIDRKRYIERSVGFALDGGGGGMRRGGGRAPGAGRHPARPAKPGSMTSGAIRSGGPL